MNNNKLEGHLEKVSQEDKVLEDLKDFMINLDKVEAKARIHSVMYLKNSRNSSPVEVELEAALRDRHKLQLKEKT